MSILGELFALPWQIVGFVFYTMLSFVLCTVAWITAATCFLYYKYPEYTVQMAMGLYEHGKNWAAVVGNATIALHNNLETCANTFN